MRDKICYINAVKTERIELSALKPYEKNPRKISAAAFDKLKNSLKDFPEMLSARPLIIDEKNKILGGNQRYLAAKAIGMKTVPVLRVTNFSEKQKKEFVLRDNTSAGEWDFDKLLKDFAEFDFGAMAIPNAPTFDILEGESEKEDKLLYVEPIQTFPYHGRKGRLLSWLVQFFPSRRSVFVDLFGGSGVVCLSQEGRRVYNDLGSHVFNFFSVVSDEKQMRELAQKMRLTPFSRELYKRAISADFTSLDPVERARLFLFRQFCSYVPVINNLLENELTRNPRRVENFTKKNWAEHLATIAEKCKGGLILENLDFEKCVARYDNRDAVIYADPPYVQDTRASAQMRAYEVETSDGFQENFLRVCLSIRGAAIVSGYDSELYNSRLCGAGWRKFTRETYKMGQVGGAVKSIEVVWINPAAQNKLENEGREM